jgi:thymidylate kinase
MAIIIEGIDNIGKSTFIQKLRSEAFPWPVVHSSKPEKLKVLGDSESLYQMHYFSTWFNMMSARKSNVIFDRLHLGEWVYAPLYRGYTPSFIPILPRARLDTVLVLLKVNDFSLIVDDGKSIDASNMQKEQELFLDAFKKDEICFNKQIIEIDRDGVRKTVDELYDEFMNVWKRMLQSM